MKDLKAVITLQDNSKEKVCPNDGLENKEVFAGELQEREGDPSA